MDSTRLIHGTRRGGQEGENRKGDTEGFVDSYRTFTTVLNRLQRQYLDLKDESQRQAKALAEANESLRALTRRNHAAMEFLNSVLASVSTGIIVADRQRNITHINPAAEALFAVKSSEALGSSLDKITGGQRMPSQATSRREKSESGELMSESLPTQFRGVERTFTIGDGEDRTYLWGSSPLLDRQGESFGSVEAFQDITVTKLMERKMTRMESLAAIGEMAATVAHQVRNPLVSVKGFASLISAQPAKGSKNKAHAEKILRGVGNLERVIDALLSYSRTETLTLRSTNLNRYLRKIVRQYNEGIVRSRNVTEVFADAPTVNKSAGVLAVVNFIASDAKLTVDIDQIILREAIVNILLNAHESSADPVTCTVLVCDCPPGGDFVKIEIRDNGPGMAPETAEGIFRPFFTTKSSGSGLGLPLSRKLINAHGGEIKVDSVLGSGTTFEIKLPLSSVQETDLEER